VPLAKRAESGPHCLAVKRFAFLISLLIITAGVTSGADRRIAFEANDAVQIANLDETVVRNLTNGIFPAISPDGKSIVFTSVQSTDGQYVRRLSTIEIASGVSQLFDAIPSDNSYYATWSPDGQWIAFTLRADGLWHLAIIKSDGTEFRFVKKGEQDKVTLYSPCWARDGKSLFCHDMTNIYRLALDGSVLAQWRIEQIAPSGGMSGDGRIDVSPDGQRLLLSMDMDEEYDRKNWDGPVPALWSYDLSTGASVRLTSKNLFAWDGCWLDDTNILFVSQGPQDKQAALYRANGKILKRLIENARRPTVSLLPK